MREKIKKGERALFISMFGYKIDKEKWMCGGGGEGEGEGGGEGEGEGEGGGRERGKGGRKEGG